MRSAAMLVLLTTIPGQCLALEQWRCTTESFAGFDTRDQEFIAKNLRKQYLLTITEDEILVKTMSKDFRDTEEQFVFVGKDLLSRYAVAEIKMSYDLFSLPTNPEQRIAQDGFFNATRMVASDSYANSWLLRCVE
jgi:hypothetical protein